MKQVKEIETKYGLVIISENDSGQIHMATWTAKKSNFVRAFMPFERAVQEGEKYLKAVEMGFEA